MSEYDPSQITGRLPFGALNEVRVVEDQVEIASTVYEIAGQYGVPVRVIRPVVDGSDTDINTAGLLEGANTGTLNLVDIVYRGRRVNGIDVVTALGNEMERAYEESGTNPRITAGRLPPYMTILLSSAEQNVFMPVEAGVDRVVPLTERVPLSLISRINGYDLAFMAKYFTEEMENATLPDQVRRALERTDAHIATLQGRNGPARVPRFQDTGLVYLNGGWQQRMPMPGLSLDIDDLGESEI